MVILGWQRFTASVAEIILPSMNGQDEGITKRQLGMILLLGGIIGFGLILAVDIIDVGREGGIGPAQTWALLAMALAALVGLSLLPLGDAPA
ncbi:MAG: hypothetical protein OXG92_13730 [Chloroflexi bacterium]|nr:hypothetical protein [Chloroflexota bacterium]MCY3717511.1 hypothetical protein [Chloroflexota bacterium]MXV93418.1 hypothetical protein [Chloroflexota bacterium]MXX49947.1 hypothetical protein [Chloroflexota bacterium]MXX82265.1 hypothetical protein [Chloroflexota bacterium]